MLLRKGTCSALFLWQIRNRERYIGGEMFVQYVLCLPPICLFHAYITLYLISSFPSVCLLHIYICLLPTYWRMILAYLQEADQLGNAIANAHLQRTGTSQERHVPVGRELLVSSTIFLSLPVFHRFFNFIPDFIFSMIIIWSFTYDVIWWKLAHLLSSGYQRLPLRLRYLCFVFRLLI